MVIGGTIVQIKRTCPECRKKQSVKVYQEDFDRWQAGTHIQNAMPYLDANSREMLLTGICPECWDKMFRDYVDDGGIV